MEFCWASAAADRSTPSVTVEELALPLPSAASTAPRPLSASPGAGGEEVPEKGGGGDHSWSPATDTMVSLGSGARLINPTCATSGASGTAAGDCCCWAAAACAGLRPDWPGGALRGGGGGGGGLFLGGGGGKRRPAGGGGTPSESASASVGCGVHASSQAASAAQPTHEEKEATKAAWRQVREQQAGTARRRKRLEEGEEHSGTQQ